jgi:hypothetical protein
MRKIRHSADRLCQGADFTKSRGAQCLGDAMVLRD